MTDIYLEVSKKKIFACSLEWPGWCRLGKTEAEAQQALLDSAPRYRVIAQRAGLDFTPGALVVVERVLGDTTTDFGAPSIVTAFDTRPKINVRHGSFPLNDLAALTALRAEIAAALSQPSDGSPLTSNGWPTSYALRRIAWHVIDHIWEIEDRRL